MPDINTQHYHDLGIIFRSGAHLLQLVLSVAPAHSSLLRTPLLLVTLIVVALDSLQGGWLLGASPAQSHALLVVPQGSVMSQDGLPILQQILCWVSALVRQCFLGVTPVNICAVCHFTLGVQCKLLVPHAQTAIRQHMLALSLAQWNGLPLALHLVLVFTQIRQLHWCYPEVQTICFIGQPWSKSQVVDSLEPSKCNHWDS